MEHTSLLSEQKFVAPNPIEKNVREICAPANSLADVGRQQ